jgi:DNA-binding NarL/FixJ family response regulator
MKPIRVLIVDDHTIVRQGLRALLLDAGEIEVVGEAGDGVEAVTEVERLEPDVVLMDLVMPGVDGASATATIVERQPRTRVLAVSGSDIDERIFSALRAGALGYVSKGSGKEELVAAIRLVAEGRASMPAEMTRKLVARLAEPAEPVEKLSDRELEVLRLTAHGLVNREIGERLSISEATVRTHLSNIFGKLDVRNRVEATLWALRTGVTQVE